MIQIDKKARYRNLGYETEYLEEVHVQGLAQIVTSSLLVGVFEDPAWRRVSMFSTTTATDLILGARVSCSSYTG
jgi:hypothetical protein